MFLGGGDTPKTKTPLSHPLWGPIFGFCFSFFAIPIPQLLVKQISKFYTPNNFAGSNFEKYSA